MKASVPCLMLVAGVSVLSACQLIGDIKERPVAAAAPDEPTTCTFPGAPADNVEGGRIRFANLFPDSGKVHLCVQSHARPGSPPFMLTRGKGQDCPDAVPFSRVLMPLALPAGSYDTFVVGEDGRGCSSSRLATLGDVAVNRDQTTTVVYMSDDAGGAQVRAYLDRTEKTQETGVRFVHAAPGVGAVDLMELGPDWPPVGARVVTSDVAYGGLPQSTAQPGQVLDKDGYLIFTKLGGGGWLGISPTQPDGPPDAGAGGSGGAEPSLEEAARYLAVGAYQMRSGVRFTSFLIGRADDLTYPVELLRCNDDSLEDNYFTNCSVLGRRDLTFLVFNSGLYGAFSPYHRERFQEMLTVLPSLDADVMCLTHMMADDDKSSMKAALEAAGYQVYFSKQDLETLVDDPTDVNGDVPDFPETPPCGDEDAQKLLEAFLACLREEANASGVLEDGRVAVSKCSASAAPMLFTVDEEVRRCFSCAIYTLTGFASIDETEELCTTNPKAGLGFKGQSGQLVASRLPMGEPVTYTLPSTAWRANVYRVPINVSPEPVVASWIDVYCAGINSSVRTEPSEPYTGPYGEGYFEKANDNQAWYQWANESMLQAHKTVDFIKRTSGGLRAILLGNFDSGPGNEDTDLSPMTPEIFDYLNGEFGLGVTDDYPWQCLLCGDNPMNADSVFFTWAEHIFLHGVRPGTVLATQRSLTQPVAPVLAEGIELPDAGGYQFEERDGKSYLLVPLGRHYAIQSTLRVSP